ncbi:unnamed protein product [Darwinula stevensoni]|uniref:Protein phosphatase 1 regulatory subunit n=1 Tax=Darwinula stevensoni TaxID=69355 RepID=A0A7R8X3U1_9CRUS|nr:unnamed protein product [Darwinula stevensoni]CAG0884736.1 unnamed protein product [Darwinula stevensoni]
MTATSLTMPTDFFLGSSPPIFGHSPVFTFFTNYRNHVSAFPGNTWSGLLERCNTTDTFVKNMKNMDRNGLRPCIIIRSPSFPENEDLTDEDNSAPTSPVKAKKRVVFADYKGMNLTEVKVMTEPSDCPPRWSPEFLEQITQGVLADVASTNWEVTFPQPAANYVQFREKLETCCVSLENVIVKDDEDEVTGTVKVKNLHFEKSVMVRVTFDDWKTFEDIPASYVTSGTEGTCVISLYDTFRFAFKIPPSLKHNRIEFCICYRSNGQEFWDSNGDLNYAITSCGYKKDAPVDPIPITKTDDAYRTEMDSWSEFASWHHLTNDGPYW